MRHHNNKTIQLIIKIMRISRKRLGKKWGEILPGKNCLDPGKSKRLKSGVKIGMQNEKTRILLVIHRLKEKIVYKCFIAPKII